MLSSRAQVYERCEGSAKTLEFCATTAGLKLTEEVHVCPVAATLSTAVPYTALSAMKDKQRVSVWPCSSFNSGSEGSSALPAPAGAASKPTALAPAPAPPSSAPSNARELARQRARESSATASPAVLAARERAKAQFAAKKAAAGES